MTETLTPLMHNNLKDIDAIEKLNETDLKCINDIKNILKRHNKEDKFGVLLLHKHFDISEDEIMLESIDVKNRILITKPQKISTLKQNSFIQTVWSFSNNPSLNKNCESCCPRDTSGKHHGYRDHC